MDVQNVLTEFGSAVGGMLAMLVIFMRYIRSRDKDVHSVLKHNTEVIGAVKQVLERLNGK